MKNLLSVVMLFSLAQSQLVFGQSPDLKERVAAIKQAFHQSQQKLKTFEWIETTTVTFKGEVKSQKQNRCYYGADGNLQKVPVSATPPPAKKRGLRGKIVENKKEELTEYMQQAVNLVKLYVPPMTDQIQQSVKSGNASIHVIPPGRAQVEFRSYVQPGDNLSITIEANTNRVLGMQVSTYLEVPNDRVSLDVRFGTLNDGTIYTTDVTLNAPGKNLGVKVQNTGYRPLTN